MINTLTRLKEIATAILYASEGLDVEHVLERIAYVAKDLAGTRYAALGIPDGKGSLRYFKTAGMTDAEIAMIEHHPRGHGLLGAIMSERQTIRLDNIQRDARSSGFPANHPPMKTFLGVPVQLGQQLFGMFYLSDKTNGENFNEGDELLVETLAGYAALAIANAEVNQQQSRMRLLEERERIGMELHDGIIQSLYGIGMQAQLLRFNEVVQPTELVPIINSLDDVIEDIRSYILQLRQRGETNLTLRQCFERITERLLLPKHIHTEIDAPNERQPFTPVAFESLCLMLNEAISNAVRHADATRLRLSARIVGRECIVSVEDNGKGFDIQHVRFNGDTGGLGLRNIQHRARLYGGEMEIRSEVGNGTCLTIRLPLRRA